jgi:hypothetical protein
METRRGFLVVAGWLLGLRGVNDDDSLQEGGNFAALLRDNAWTQIYYTKARKGLAVTANYVGLAILQGRLQTRFNDE